MPHSGSFETIAPKGMLNASSERHIDGSAVPTCMYGGSADLLFHFILVLFLLLVFAFVVVA